MIYMLNMDLELVSEHDFIQNDLELILARLLSCLQKNSFHFRTQSKFISFCIKKRNKIIFLKV